MPTVHELLTEQFYRWEARGRGWQVFPYPVSPEPPFVPFQGHQLANAPVVDDGRRPTVLSSFMNRLSAGLAGRCLDPSPPPPEDDEPEPDPLYRSPPVELQVSLPRDAEFPRPVFAHFLQSIGLLREPVSFEVLAVGNQITLQFSIGEDDLPLVRRQMEAAFPGVSLLPLDNHLATVWGDREAEGTAIVEFGLAREFMLPLATSKLDPLTGITAALSGLEPDELGLFQVLFTPLQQPWAESMVRSVTDPAGRPFFANAPELTRAAEHKSGQSLYALVLRVAARAVTFDRAWSIARDVASALRVFAHPGGNELIPLRNDEYPFADHVEDVLLRQSRRSGMILTLEELTGFVHLPSREVPNLARERTKSRAVPGNVRSSTGILLGTNNHAGVSTEVRLSPEQRVRHCHIIGASGTGKSTQLYNLIRQDLEHGEGLAVLDPHGDLIDRLLGVIPEHRIKDVILFDPADEEYAIGFNVLSAHSDLEKTLLASDLVSVFQRLSTSWGDQLGSVLQNAVLAFLESSRGGTLADLRRFLIEADYRAEFLTTVRDSEVVYYWKKAFPLLSGNRSIGPVLTRLDTFLGRKAIRHLVAQPVNRLDFGRIMDEGKILLAKLPEGLLGRENAQLLGTLLVAKFQQLAMSRQAHALSARRDFWIYLDEFASFISPSMAEILTGARKYRVGLTLAHHELRQLERDKEVASAVLANCQTRVVFRVGDDDARKLNDGFANFEARDLQNLEIGQAICRVERSDFDFNLTVPRPQEPEPDVANHIRQQVITISRKEYGTLRAEVEARLARAVDTKAPPPPAKPPAAVPPPVATTPPAEPPPPAPVPKVPEPAQPDDRERMIEPVIPPPPIPRELGRGGAQHRSIQERIQTEARKLGFMAEIERQLAPHSNEAADLILRKDDVAIAVEISITTTVDHEFGNVRKCLAAGFTHVAVVSPKPGPLSAIAAAVKAGLAPEQAARVSFHSPEELIAHLHTLTTPESHSPPEKATRHGYTIKRTVSALSPEERSRQEETQVSLIADAMKRNLK